MKPGAIPDILQSEEAPTIWYLNPRSGGYLFLQSTSQLLVFSWQWKAFQKLPCRSNSKGRERDFAKRKPMRSAHLISKVWSCHHWIVSSSSSASLPSSPAPWGSFLSPIHLPWPLPLEEKDWKIAHVLPSGHTAAWVRSPGRTAMQFSSWSAPKWKAPLDLCITRGTGSREGVESAHDSLALLPLLC